MAFHTNYARSSRKEYLINLIAAKKNEVPSAKEVKRLRRMTVAQLEQYYLDEKVDDQPRQ